jgi:ABC-type Zn uptake system ZnuABC Zn-binding protein ZnuA
MKTAHFLIFITITLLMITACTNETQITSSRGIKVLAAESFLTDIAQQVAGNRIKVEGLIPIGMEPHAYEPAPRDVARVAESNLLIISGAGLEEWLKGILTNIGGSEKIIEASSGLTAMNGDPHFWLNPQLMLTYVDNIRDAMARIDTDGKDEYASNAAAYKQKLLELDAWIKQEVEKIPPENRLLVTNHETLGYFASRYGFQVIGSLVASLSSEAAPSPRELAQLSDNLKTLPVRVIFLDVGSNPNLAEQIAAETKAQIITSLYSESLSPAGGPAATYLEMMKHNVSVIVSALQ